MLTFSLMSTGEDVYYCPDQSKIAVPLIEQLLAYASGKDAEGKPLLTPKDLSQALSQRRADVEPPIPIPADVQPPINPKFSTTFRHRLFGSAKFVSLLTLF
jgi:hypothetical protein